MKDPGMNAYELSPSASNRRLTPQPDNGILVQHYPNDQTYFTSPEPGRSQLKGYMHIFDTYTVFKAGFPHFYRKAGLGYEKITQDRHVDWFEREWVGDYDDRYISSFDAKISKLVVQAVDDIYDNHTNSTWRRTFIRNVSPLYLRLADWPLNHVNYAQNDGKPTSEDWPLICGKWLAACFAITFVIGTPYSGEPRVRNNGNYDPFPYRHLGYPKVARNLLEMDTPHGYRLSETNPIAERLLRPTHLCFLTRPGEPAERRSVAEELAQSKTEQELSYIFVAYTTLQFDHQNEEDMRALDDIAETAARRAGVSAYWIGSCCTSGEDEDDVYRICDVVRGAHSLVLAVGRPSYDSSNIDTTDKMLLQWGQRIWTFPEVLLAPEGKVIEVYTRGLDLESPYLLEKKQFAAKVWPEDAFVARQLVDHYEGNLILSQLELVTLALECLNKRQTIEKFRGDHSYALMGLLRLRPKIDSTDSAFQAFARLSLANGSDQLLERLICVLPSMPNQPWHAMNDAFQAKLWDILPQDTSVAGIGTDDTVILDGCRAANVRWKSFTPVAHDRIFSWKRCIALWLLHLSGYAFWFSIVLLVIYPAAGIPIFIYSIITVGLSPWLLRVMYRGKFWGTQGWFFGFEGYMDIETIERQIFGARLGRMKWSTYSSPLSRHHRNVYGECVSDDPCSHEDIRELVERAKYAKPGEQRIFTLVDTGAMTATLFLAVRPPVCFLLAGSEGGMLRAIGCSYDWTTATLYRETVLRMETPIQERMMRVNRVKIGFNRSQRPVRALQEVGEAQGRETN